MGSGTNLGDADSAQSDISKLPKLVHVPVTSLRYLSSNTAYSLSGYTLVPLHQPTSAVWQLIREATGLSASDSLPGKRQPIPGARGLRIHRLPVRFSDLASRLCTACR